MENKQALVNCPHCGDVAYRSKNGIISCYECCTSTDQSTNNIQKLDLNLCLDNREYIYDQLSLHPEDRDHPSLFI